MANRKLGNLENLGNLGNIILSFLISEFSILAVGQNRKLGFKNLGKKFPRFSRIPRFPSFRSGSYYLHDLFETLTLFTFNSQMATIRAFFPKSKHLFPIFEKGQGIPPPSLFQPCACYRTGTILQIKKCGTYGIFVQRRRTDQRSSQLHKQPYSVSFC